MSQIAIAKYSVRGSEGDLTFDKHDKIYVVSKDNYNTLSGYLFKDPDHTVARFNAFPMSTQIRESSSVTNCNTLENDIHSVNAIETIEEEEKKMSWGDLIIEELGREDSLKYHEENPKIKT
ncbi:hypothetical protein M0813_26555 [Anaeramoeba flamelloides]|uniref:Uncharacterized protein n=1 Tax=Anaeramoeba flamelloides TaxID=1746091 RepID=A0ABQ8XYU3_9EUKA|nr:hypothetical protein M0813_26555 [Anaeramoeba flamelloides]